MMGIMTRRFMSICGLAEGQQKTKSIQLNKEHDPFEDLLVQHVSTLVAASPPETPQQDPQSHQNAKFSTQMPRCEPSLPLPQNWHSTSLFCGKGKGRGECQDFCFKTNSNWVTLFFCFGPFVVRLKDETCWRKKPF